MFWEFSGWWEKSRLSPEVRERGHTGRASRRPSGSGDLRPWPRRIPMPAMGLNTHPCRVMFRWSRCSSSCWGRSQGTQVTRWSHWSLEWSRRRELERREKDTEDWGGPGSFPQSSPRLLARLLSSPRSSLTEGLGVRAWVVAAEKAPRR